MARVTTSEEASTLAQKRWGKRKEAEAEARSRRISALADRAEMEAATMRRDLVERQPILDMVRNLAQQERDAILSWPARAVPLLAADLGINEHALHAALDASLRAHLAERAGQSLEI